MEDILSIVVVILIAVAGVAKKNKNKKTKQKVRGNGFGEMKEFITDAGTSVIEILDDDEEEAYTSPAKLKARRMKAKPASQPAMPMKTVVPIREGQSMPSTKSTQGRSLFEDQGCIGGSIAHDSHEGDSSYPYGASEGAASYEDSAAFAEDIVHELQSMNVQRLRRAIVVSEILDRPKALRRR